MIDEKKIQKGIKACFDRRIDDKVEREFMRDPPPCLYESIWRCNRVVQEGYLAPRRRSSRD